MTLGAALFASGTALSVGWWIYGMQARPAEAFWQWPSWLGAGLLAVGGLCLAVGLFKRDPDSAAPAATADNHSVVQQTSVGDINTSGGGVDISQEADGR